MALVTLDTVKTFLQITGTSSDTILNLYIDLISSEINAYVGRNLDETYYVDEPLEYQFSKYDPSSNRPLDVREPNPQVFLREYPVQGLEITSRGTTVPTSDYTLDHRNGVVTFFKSYTDYKERLKASYTAGYTTITGATYTVPSNLQLVALEGVKRLYTNGGAAEESSGDVTSKKVKDFSVQYGGTANSSNYFFDSNSGLVKAYLEANSTTLNRYRKVVI